MGSKAFLLLGVLANLAAALVPPCLPQLGSEFCPSAAAHVAALPAFPEWPVDSFTYPDQMYQEKVLRNLVFPQINKTHLVKDVSWFTTENPEHGPRFPNRYCLSSYGKDAEEELSLDVLYRTAKGFEDINSTHPISIQYIDNFTPQRSIILKILPEETWSRSQDIVVIGAHFDSYSYKKNSSMIDEDMIAPGADDNASAFTVLTETAAVLAHLFARKRVLNEVQFHFWAAEEIGLVGSRSVFENMRNNSRSVKAVLNLDMVGYSAGHKAGSPIIAMYGDHTNGNLTDFTTKVIQTYTNAAVGIWECGYSCSDHVSAWEYGFPSAGVSESAFLNKNSTYPYMHTEFDTIDHLDFDYMLDFVKLSAGFVAELAYTNFSALN